MGKLISMYPIVEAVQDLKTDTLEWVKYCQTAKAMKLLLEVYDILEITDEINLKYNNPVKDYIVCDLGVLKEMRDIISYLVIYNDPERRYFGQYVSKVTKTLYVYNQALEGLKCSNRR